MDKTDKQLNKEILDRLTQKFFNDPDFHYVLEMLSKNVESMRDIVTIDLTQSAETIKAIVAGRQETLQVIDRFKKDVEVAKGIINNKGVTFK